jgi:hypothetical protein
VTDVCCCRATAAGFAGFVSMCVWANYSNKDGIEYGSCFILVIASWLLYFLAAVVGFWESGNGIPDRAKRVFGSCKPTLRGATCRAPAPLCPCFASCALLEARPRARCRMQ